MLPLLPPSPPLETVRGATFPYRAIQRRGKVREAVRRRGSRGRERGFPAMTLPPPPPSLPPSSFKPPSPPSSSYPRIYHHHLSASPKEGKKTTTAENGKHTHTHIPVYIPTQATKVDFWPFFPAAARLATFCFLLCCFRDCGARPALYFPSPFEANAVIAADRSPSTVIFLPLPPFSHFFLLLPNRNRTPPLSHLPPFNPFLLASRLNAYIYSSRGRDKRLFPSFGKAAVFHFFFPPLLSPRPADLSIADAIVAAPPPLSHKLQDESFK